MIKKLSLIFQVVLYVSAGINHFIHPAFYINMIPFYLPGPSLLVMISGIIEISLGLLLIPPVTRKWSAIIIALMLVVFLSVHIDMAYQSFVVENYNLKPIAAILRLLIQPLLIVWVLWCGEVVKKEGGN